jgi:eukaryotic-like serine/threonine-protein kinase
MTITPGTVLADRWEITSRVAVGGMAEVHRAEDRLLERTVAIKLLRTHEARAAERFSREVTTHASLQHPDIVVLFDAGEHDGSPFLVMEFVDGPSLADLLLEGPLPLDRVRDLGRRMASALAYAHEQGVVHRDVKPGNVLFDAAGDAHLADFGIVRLADAAGATGTGTAMGTPGYIAPEQLTAQDEVAGPADVYALGLVLLEAATGRREFVGHATEAAMARLSRDPDVPDDLPADLRRLLGEMTSREPDERPTAADVAARIVSGSAAARDDERTRTAVLPDIEDGPGGDAAASAAETEVIAEEQPAGPGGAGPSPAFLRGPRGWVPYAVAGAVGLIAIVAISSGLGTDGGTEDGTGEVAGEDDAGETEPQPIEPALDAAFEELDRAVRP